MQGNKEIRTTFECEPREKVRNYISTVYKKSRFLWIPSDKMVMQDLFMLRYIYDSCGYGRIR